MRAVVYMHERAWDVTERVFACKYGCVRGWGMSAYESAIGHECLRVCVRASLRVCVSVRVRVRVCLRSNMRVCVCVSVRSCESVSVRASLQVYVLESLCV